MKPHNKSRKKQPKSSKTAPPATGPQSKSAEETRAGGLTLHPPRTFEVPLVRLEGYSRKEKQDGTIVYKRQTPSPRRDYSTETSKEAFDRLCEHLPSGISRRDLESRSAEYTDSDASDESTTPPGRVRDTTMDKNGIAPSHITIRPERRDVSMQELSETVATEWLMQLPKFDRYIRGLREKESKEDWKEQQVEYMHFMEQRCQKSILQLSFDQMRTAAAVDPKPKSEPEVITYPSDWRDQLQESTGKPLSDRRRGERLLERREEEMERLLYTSTGVPRSPMTRTWLYINRYDTVPYGAEWEKEHTPTAAGAPQPVMTWEKNEIGLNVCSIDIHSPFALQHWNTLPNYDAKESTDLPPHGL
jgi:hypothetical protein